jgi:transcriptional regulator with XRE-family HTH domain
MSIPPQTRGSPVGRLLQQWRQVRRKSQLELALDANISARHLSFVESGRANPSRDMVLLLARTLDVPFREQNDLLVAAGFAHVYREIGWNQPELAQARRAVDLILRHQEPFPAVVMDRHWNLITSNRAAERLFARLLEGSNPLMPPNVIRLMFHSEGLRPWVSNWGEVAPMLLQRVHREALGGFADETTQHLLNEVRAYPGVAASLDRVLAIEASSPVFPVQFRKGKLALDFFSTVTTLGTPRDITMQEIRIECFFPANPETEYAARKL